MAPTQSLTFLVPAGEVDRVVATIRANFANALIGRKPHDSESMLLAVTLYADAPEAMLPPQGALALAASELGASGATTGTLRDLIAAILQKQA